MFSRGALVFRVALAAWVVLLGLSVASAQDQDRSSAVFDIFKRVVSDPTTYVPALVSAEAQYLDWQSSQVFFQHGSLERNPEFTVSGRADDTPVTYEAGNRQIVNDAFRTLGSSLVNNVTVAIVERALIKRYPTHRKLLRGIGWTERIAYASWLSYRQSATYFHQWRRNGELAQQFGY